VEGELDHRIGRETGQRDRSAIAVFSIKAGAAGGAQEHRRAKAGEADGIAAFFPFTTTVRFNRPFIERS